MRFLVLGNINSKWVKEYIEFVLLPLGYEVEVVGRAKDCKYGEFYRKNNVVIRQEIPAGRLSGRIPFIRVISSALRTVKRNEWSGYDVILNMFVNHRNLMITSKLKTKNTKTIVYYTGSDLLRKDSISILLNRLLLRHPDIFAVGSETLADCFRKKYPAGTPVTVINFGISAFENIKNNRKIADKNSRSVFCIGYSGVKAHNHLDVINVFDRLTAEQKEKTELVVPMTYMATPEYLAQVKEKLDGVGIRYKLLTEYMDNDAMAKTWCGIDYFINAQSTDSLSASVLEALYAGVVLLNAQWLDYPEYRELDLKYVSFADYDELFDRISEIIDGKVFGDEYFASDKLEKRFGWTSVKDSWQELFGN